MSKKYIKDFAKLSFKEFFDDRKAIVSKDALEAFNYYNENIEKEIKNEIKTVYEQYLIFHSHCKDEIDDLKTLETFKM
jgi:hypothetical protein